MDTERVSGFRVRAFGAPRNDRFAGARFNGNERYITPMTDPAANPHIEIPTRAPVGDADRRHCHAV